jgi:hypothetical protein
VGHTLTDWDARVALWLHDAAQLDVTHAGAIEDLGLPAALAQYAQDRAGALVTVDAIGNGTAYLSFPVPPAAQYNAATDAVQAVEYPVGDLPPSYLDGAEWAIGGTVADPSLTRLILYSASPAVGAKVRVTFTSSSPLPFPTDDTADDLVPESAFVFVAALAAAYVCLFLLAEAASDRQAAIPTDFADGSQRALMLQQQADRLTNIYRTFMGLPPVGAGGGVPESPSRPAYGRFTISSGQSSIFHRGP